MDVVLNLLVFAWIRSGCHCSSYSDHHVSTLCLLNIKVWTITKLWIGKSTIHGYVQCGYVGICWYCPFSPQIFLLPELVYCTNRHKYSLQRWNIGNIRVWVQPIQYCLRGSWCSWPFLVSHLSLHSLHLQNVDLCQLDEHPPTGNLEVSVWTRA